MPVNLSQWQRRWIADIYVQGRYSMDELADFLHMTRKSVTRILIQTGVKPPPNAVKPPLETRRAEFEALGNKPPEREDCPICHRTYPRFRIADLDGTELGCERCLTIRRYGVREWQ